MGERMSDDDEPIRYISLFSGIEAASVAWQHLGWQPVAFSDFDDFASAVLEHHYPDVPNVGDVTKHDWTQYRGKCDLIIGGSPCQSFSIAGKRLGLSDPRGNLALHFLRVVADVQPRWFVFENVAGLLSSDEGRDFGTFLSEVAKLGYGFAYRTLDSRFFGVPQKRRRVFVVGHIAGDWRGPAASLFDPESVQRDSKARRQTRQKSTRLANGSTSGESESLQADGERRRGMSLQTPLNDPSETLVASYALGAGNRAGIERNVVGVAEDDVTTVGFWTSQSSTQRSQMVNRAPCMSASTPTGVAFDKQSLNVPSVGFWSNESTTQHSSMVDMQPCLRTQASAVAFDKTPVGFTPWRRGGSEEGIFPTQTAKHENGVAHLKEDDIDQDIIPNLRYSVRRLTPIECERLQGFPDDYTKVPYNGKPASECPKSKRYFALGNSMTTNVIRWIGEGIQAVDSIGAPPPSEFSGAAETVIENGVIIQKPSLDAWFD